MPKLRERRKRAAAQAKPQPAALDIEAQAADAKRARAAMCEAEVQKAIVPILARYRCRLGTMQQIIDGQPGPVQVLVFTLD